MNGGPVRVPSNIAIAVSGGAIAIGNPGNRLSHSFGRSVRVGIRRGMVGISHPSRTGRRHTLRKAAHTLLTGVIRNISGKFREKLRLVNINCHTRGRNGGLILGINCSRPIRVRPRRNVRIRIPSGAGVVIGNADGRHINTLTTGVHSIHPPRPCGNGNVHCRNRCIHHGRNGANGWYHLNGQGR